MIRAVLSIGSNMDNRLGLLAMVFEEFAGDIVASSPVYATQPWGVEDQEEFLNAALIVEVEQSPMELLRRGQALEDAAERVRVRRWGPRTLDVDLVQVWQLDEAGQPVEEITSVDPVLTLPHPYAHQRAFVMVPWLAMDPGASLRGRRVDEWCAELPEKERAGVRALGRLEELPEERA